MRNILGGSVEGVGLHMPDKEVDKLISEVDYNNDDRIDYAEFMAMMKRDLKGPEVEEAVKRQASGVFLN